MDSFNQHDRRLDWYQYHVENYVDIALIISILTSKPTTFQYFRMKCGMWNPHTWTTDTHNIHLLPVYFQICEPYTRITEQSDLPHG